MQEPSNTQDILLSVTKIYETEHSGDASALLSRHSFVLLGISENSFSDEENRFIYSLGYVGDPDEMSDWAKNFF